MTKSILLGLLIFGHLLGCKSENAEQIATEVQSNTKILTPAPNALSSQATMIYKRYLLEKPDGSQDFFIDNAPKVKDHYSIEEGEICEDQENKDLPMVANCSGILVGPDLILTAGQCFLAQREACRDFKWIFDYSPKAKSFSSHQVYSCKKILHYSVSVDLSETADQFALIQLDRIVKNREPLKLAKTRADKGSVLGNLFGLIPGKSIDKDLSDEDPFLKASFDEEFSSMGSSILNKENEILGIVIRSEGGFLKDETKGCYVPKTCENSDCSQTIVDPIEHLPLKAKNMIYKSLAYGAILEKDASRIEELIYAGLNLKIKDQYDRTLVLKTIEFNQVDLFKMFLKVGTDLNATDTIGQGLFHYIVRGNAFKILDFFSTWHLDINKKDSLGRTALDLAMALKREQMVSRLKDMGAKTGNIKTNLSFVEYCQDPYASEEIKLTVKALKDRVAKENCDEAYLSLSELKHLFIGGSEIIDLRPLRSFNKLRQLQIASGDLEDLSFLEGFNSLEKLTIKNSKIRDLRGLQNLESLKELIIHTKADFSPLTSLSSLTKLEVSTDRLTSTAFLTSMTELEELTIVADVEVLLLPVLEKLEVIKLSLGRPFNLAELSKLPALTKITAEDNDLTDISALASMTQLQRIYIGKNKITDLSPLAGLKKLKTVSVRGNPVKKGEEFCPTKSVASSLARFCRTNNRRR